MSLQKMTALVIDRDWHAHWVTMNAADAAAMAENAIDELADDVCDTGEDECGLENPSDLFEDNYDKTCWKDDVRLVRVWAGEHSSVPAEAALYEEGDWPQIPAPGTVFTFMDADVEVLAALPEGYENHDNNPFLIPVRSVSGAPLVNSKHRGLLMSPSQNGLIVAAV